MIAVGITASRNGMTQPQSLRVRAALANLRHFNGAIEFHHGDCVRGDELGAAIARSLGYVLVSHPPTDPRLRAFVVSDRTLPEKPYLRRNDDIAETVDMLLGCPELDVEQPRGGTWYTIRRAREVGTHLMVIGSRGQILEHTGPAA